MEKLFVYGTLRHQDVQIELFGREVASRDDTLPGYAIEPIQLGDETHRLAVPNADGAIVGKVLELTSDELGTCDAYEPEEYKRVEVTLESGETAWAYVAAK